MATNRICYPLTKIPEHLVEKVKVPVGATYYGGDVVMCETLDTTYTPNREVYAATPIANVTTDIPCIIINGGFEQLADGRRPEGQPNPGQYGFTAGQVCTAIRLTNDLKFFISDDAIAVGANPAIAVGKFFIPVNGAVQMTTSATVGTSITALSIEKQEYMGIGGQFGMTFANGSVTRVKQGR